MCFHAFYWHKKHLKRRKSLVWHFCAFCAFYAFYAFYAHKKNMSENRLFAFYSHKKHLRRRKSLVSLLAFMWFLGSSKKKIACLTFCAFYAFCAYKKHLSESCLFAFYAFCAFCAYKKRLSESCLFRICAYKKHLSESRLFALYACKNI